MEARDLKQLGRLSLRLADYSISNGPKLPGSIYKEIIDIGAVLQFNAATVVASRTVGSASTIAYAEGHYNLGHVMLVSEFLGYSAAKLNYLNKNKPVVNSEAMLDAEERIQPVLLADQPDLQKY